MSTKDPLDFLREALHHSEILPINRSSRLYKDLGVDSLELLEVIMEVESEYHITIEDSEICESSTVGDIIDLINAKRKRNS